MSYASKNSPPPPAETAAEFGRTEQEVIDEDLHVTIYKSDASSNWYVQYNHPSEGQRKQSLRTKNKKEARRKAWEIISKLRAGGDRRDGPAGPAAEGSHRGFSERQTPDGPPGVDAYRISPHPGTVLPVRIRAGRRPTRPAHAHAHGKLRNGTSREGHCHEAGEEDPRPTGEEEQIHLSPREDQACEEFGQVGGGHAEAAGEPDLRLPVARRRRGRELLLHPGGGPGDLPARGAVLRRRVPLPGPDRPPAGRVDVAHDGRLRCGPPPGADQDQGHPRQWLAVGPQGRRPQRPALGPGPGDCPEDAGRDQRPLAVCGPAGVGRGGRPPAGQPPLGATRRRRSRRRTSRRARCTASATSS